MSPTTSAAKQPGKRPASKKRTTPKNSRQLKLPLLNVLAGIADEERADDPLQRPPTATTMARLLKIRQALRSDQQQVAYLTPAGSFLDIVTALFAERTDISQKLALFAGMAHVSALLLSRHAKVDMNGCISNPTMWAIVLAESGSGKTLTGDFMSNVAPVALFPGGSTAARVIADLAHHNRSLWFQDEFGLFLENIERSDAHSDLKDYLLRIYDGKELQRRTKKEVICIKAPCLTILGTTVTRLFHQQMRPEDLLSGLAQRFQYVHIDADHKKKAMSRYTIFESQSIQAARTSWELMLQTRIHPVYGITELATKAFDIGFEVLLGKSPGIDRSFFRRVLWQAPKYALMHHILLRKDTPELDYRDMVWGLRVAKVHLQDFCRVMERFETSSLASIVKKAEEAQADFIAKYGRPMKARDLVARVREVENVSQARFILDILSGNI